MKKIKFALSLFMAFMMVFALSSPVTKAEGETSTEYKIKIKESASGHTYDAYQVFKGTLTDGKLYSIEWADGVNSANLLTALKANTNFEKELEDKTRVNVFANAQSANDVASVLNSLTAEQMSSFADVVSQNLTTTKITSVYSETDKQQVITVNSAGYYFIKDSGEVTGDDTYTKFILQVVGKDTDVALKTDKPSVEKKVQENTKYTEDGGYGSGYNDVADYNIGDSVPFHLIGVIPDMTNYTTYKTYTFTDTLSKGLTFPVAENVKVYLSTDKKLTDKSDITSNFNVVFGTDDKENSTMTVSLKDGNDLKTIATDAKYKYVIVEYSATLNANAVVGLDGNPNEVSLKYSNNPNGEGEGETPKDKVVVFTYKLDVTKEDATTGQKLENVEFKLQNPTTKKWLTVDASNKVTGWADTEEAGTALKSNKDGLFSVIGLDDGTYTLKETEALEGYNTLKEFNITLTATTTNGQTWTSGNANEALTKLELTTTDTTNTTVGESNVSNGTVSLTVKNVPASSLPSTGGIGNYVFYGASIVMVGVAAGYFLMQKRKRA